MWNWIRPASTPPATPSAIAAPDPPPAAPRGQVKSGPYRLLHEYLRKRYADTVVLTFAQIEDLLVPRCRPKPGAIRTGGAGPP
jgi:hypothetical protein